MNKQTYLKLLIVGIVVVFAVAWRLFAGPLLHIEPNFTPVIAMAIFAGAVLGARKVWAYLLPLGIMFISDLFIGLHSTIPAVYLGIIVAVLLGSLMLKRISGLNVILSGLAAALVFFIISNFGVWVTGMVGYPMNFSGLVDCYIAGIPFFRYMLISTLAFNIVFFLAYSLLRSRVRVLA